MKCQTKNCERAVAYEGHAFCDDCFAVVLRTGRPPVIEERFVPEWRKRLQAKDFTRSTA